MKQPGKNFEGLNSYIFSELFLNNNPPMFVTQQSRSPVDTALQNIYVLVVNLVSRPSDNPVLLVPPVKQNVIIPVHFFPDLLPPGTLPY